MDTTAGVVSLGLIVEGGGIVQSPGAMVPLSMSALVVELLTIVIETAASLQA